MHRRGASASRITVARCSLSAAIEGLNVGVLRLTGCDVVLVDPHVLGPAQDRETLESSLYWEALIATSSNTGQTWTSILLTPSIASSSTAA